MADASPAQTSDDKAVSVVRRFRAVKVPGVTSEARGRIGTVLDRRWRLDRLIGVGGSAAVYAATHRNGHRVAIKILHRKLATKGRIATLFFREARTVNRVRHRGMVAVTDEGTTSDGEHFMVMELLEGETLTERWARSGPTVPTQDVLAFMHAALDVLAAAHSHGVLHRDLKPDNLFITQEGQLRVLDFGLGRLPNDPEMTLARPGALLGTPGFMSPEQTRGDWARVDHRTDIWAIGAIMYVLLSGQAVHGAPTSVASVVAAMNEAPRPLASRAPHVPREVAEIVDRALALEPEQRWQSAADMRRAVRDAYWAHIARSRRAVAAEQRRHKRFPIGIAAAIESVDENTIGVVVDGSKSGVLLRTTSSFHIGQRLVVDFRFPGDSTRRRLSGWVTRTAEDALDTSPFRRLVAIGFDSHYSLLTHDPKPKNETRERQCESR